MYFVSGVKDRNVTTQLTYFEAPTSFWWELKTLSTSLMDNVNGKSSVIKLQYIETPHCTSQYVFIVDLYSTYYWRCFLQASHNGIT